MRVTRTYSINEELLEPLKQTNASELINQLLLEYFNKDELRDLNILKQKALEKQQELEIVEKQLEHINQNINTVEAEEYKAKKDAELTVAEKEYKDKAEEIQEQYKDDELTEDEFFEKIDELREAKPVRDDTQLHEEEKGEAQPSKLDEEVLRPRVPYD